MRFHLSVSLLRPTRLPLPSSCRYSTPPNQPITFARSNIRKMSTTISPSHPPTPVFSSNYPSPQNTRDLAPLLLSSGGRWSLSSNGAGLERHFKFRTFKKTWEFMNIIAAECVVRKHHPEWSNVYNTTFIRWTTHSPPGLSEKDVVMARYCDEQAALCGEEDPVESAAQVGRELADAVASKAGDCCVPKKEQRQPLS